MRSVNFYLLRSLFRPKEWVRMMELQDSELLLSKKSGETMFIKVLYNAGYSVDEIAKVLRKRRRDIASKLRSGTTRRIKNLFWVCNPLRAYEVAKENVGVLKASRRYVYTILAIEFIKAGWNNRQIAYALSISERTVSRIRRRLEDGEYE